LPPFFFATRSTLSSLARAVSKKQAGALFFPMAFHPIRPSVFPPLLFFPCSLPTGKLGDGGTMVSPFFFFFRHSRHGGFFFLPFLPSAYSRSRNVERNLVSPSFSLSRGVATFLFRRSTRSKFDRKARSALSSIFEVRPSSFFLRRSSISSGPPTSGVFFALSFSPQTDFPFPQVEVLGTRASSFFFDRLQTRSLFFHMLRSPRQS